MRLMALVIVFMSFFCATATAKCLFGAENWRAEFPYSSASYQSTTPGLSENDLERLGRAGVAITYSFEYVPERLDNRFRIAASLLGRLEILTGGGGEDPTIERCVDYCTATLVDVDIILTAGHCLIEPIQRQGAKLEGLIFRRGGEGDSDPGVLFDVELDAVEAVFGGETLLDYAILRLKTPVADIDPAVFELFEGIEKEEWESSEIAIIGYPLGTGLMMSRRGCYLARTLPLSGRSGGPKVNFRHVCSTTEGMSGAPIFDELTGKIVGIHTGGGLLESARPDRVTHTALNKGVVLAEIKQSSRFFNGTGPEPVDIGRTADLAFDDLQQSLDDPERRIETMTLDFTLLGKREVTPTKLAALVHLSNQILHPENGEQCPVVLRVGEIESGSGPAVISSQADQLAVLRSSRSLFSVVDQINFCGGFGPNYASCSVFGKGAMIVDQINRKSLLREIGFMAGLTNADDNTFMNPRAQGDAFTRQQCAKLIQFAGQRRQEQRTPGGE
jgi:V8-like Glu-specific endopeptidase